MRPGRPLRRRKPLGSAAARPLERRSRLRSVSDAKRAALAEDAAQVAREGAAFRAAIRGEACIVCGRSERKAQDETGWGHHAHHAIRQEVLRRLGLQRLLWDPGNATALCEEPCHRRHSRRIRRIPRSALPPRVLAFAAEHGLERELELEYPE